MKIRFLTLMVFSIFSITTFSAERSDSQDDADDRILQRSIAATNHAWNQSTYSPESAENICGQYMDSLFQNAQNSREGILNILQFAVSLTKDDDSSSEDDQPNGLPVHRVVISGTQELPKAAQNLTLPHKEPSAAMAGPSAPTSAAATACVSSTTGHFHRVVSGAPENAAPSGVARIIQLPPSPTYASITRVGLQPPSIQLGTHATPNPSRGAFRGAVRGHASRGKARGGHSIMPSLNRSAHQ